MLTCDHTTRLGAYLDGELDAEARRALEGHVEACAACREGVRALRGLSALFAGRRGRICRKPASAGFTTG